MQKWEYCRVTWTWSVISQDIAVRVAESLSALYELEAYAEGDVLVKGGTVEILGADEEPETFFELAAVLARLGREGWELVGSNAVAPGVATLTRENLYFKRPLQDS